MDSPENFILETSRLLIREWELSDIAALVDIINDQSFHFGGLGRGEPSAIEFVNKAIERRLAKTAAGKRASYRLAVVLKETNQLVGYVAAGMYTPDPQLEKYGYELAFFTHPRFEKNGYALESSLALLKELNHRQGITEFYATSTYDNLPAVKILQKLGFILEHRFDTEYLSHVYGSDRQLFTLNLPENAAENIVIRTPRLILREFAADDFDALMEIANQPGFSFHSFKNDKQSIDRFLHNAMRRRELLGPSGKRASFRLAVTLPSGKLIGYQGLAQLDPEPQLAEFGYESFWFIHPEYQKQGYNKEAAEALTSFAQKQYGINRFFATVSPDNIASVKTLQHLGFKLNDKDCSFLTKDDGKSRVLYTLDFDKS